MIIPQWNTTNVFNKIALIDADRLKHLVTHDLIYVYGPDPGNIESKTIHDFTKERMKTLYKDEFTAHANVYCFSGKSYGTFRNSISFTQKYKGKRKDSNDYPNKLLHQTEVVRYVMSTEYVLLFEELEADDLLSALQNEHTFIFSNDKDLLQIPGLHYDPNIHTLKKVSYEEAVYNLTMQLLTGDSVDNIQGIPGTGAVGAKKIIEDCHPKKYFYKALNAYQKKFGIINGTDAFCENWMLVKLRTNRGDLFKEKYQAAFNLINALCNSLPK